MLIDEIMKSPEVKNDSRMVEEMEKREIKL
jgi:hypothetical protein